MNEPDSPKTPAESLEQLDQVEALVWALLDEQITPFELEQLEGMLLTEEAARTRYFECVQMHTNLRDFYQSRLPQGMLPPINPAAGLQPPLTDPGTPATG